MRQGEGGKAGSVCKDKWWSYKARKTLWKKARVVLKEIGGKYTVAVHINRSASMSLEDSI